MTHDRQKAIKFNRVSYKNRLIFVGWQKNIGQHVWESSGVLLCHWSACCLQWWRPSRLMWKSRN